MPLGGLVLLLAAFLTGAAFFSAVEIAWMAVGPQRLRRLFEHDRLGRMLAKLLAHPDRALGVILLAGTLCKAFAGATAATLAMHFYLPWGVALVIGLGAIALLVFIDIAPRTLAALAPERVARPAAYFIAPLLTLLYPVVWLSTLLANRSLRALGRRGRRQATLGAAERRAAVIEAASLVPERHHSLLLGVLELERTTVDEIMVPRRLIEAIDLDADWAQVLERLGSARFTRLPVYRDSFAQVVGNVHVRKALHLLQRQELDLEHFNRILSEPYFVPRGTLLHTQLANFRAAKRRTGLVVDEYGEVLGLITLEDILQRIVGPFTGDSWKAEDAQAQADGSFLVRGAAMLRDLNRALGWQLPLSGPATLNGAIVEYLEDIPAPGISLRLGDYEVEVVRTRGTTVQLARVRPPMETDSAGPKPAAKPPQKKPAVRQRKEPQRDKTPR